MISRQKNRNSIAERQKIIAEAILNIERVLILSRQKKHKKMTARDGKHEKKT